MGRVTRDIVVRELQEVRETVDRLLTAAKRGAMDPCDCGHLAIEHGLIRDGDSAACMMRPCLIAGCECVHFDDAAQQINELRRKKRLAEQEVARWGRQLREAEAA